MGRRAKVLPPEQADSWGEFHARLEFEASAMGPWTTPLCWCLGGALLGVALICCAYALQYRHWWLWVAMLAALRRDPAVRTPRFGPQGHLLPEPPPPAGRRGGDQWP